jgi:hypothetical protein
MARSDDFQQCHHHLRQHIETVQKRIVSCEQQLRDQEQAYPIQTLPLHRVDHCLKAYVDCQRKYLKMRNNDQLAKFKETSKEKELTPTVLTSHLTTEQVGQY